MFVPLRMAGKIVLRLRRVNSEEVQQKGQWCAKHPVPEWNSPRVREDGLKEVDQSGPKRTERRFPRNCFPSETAPVWEADSVGRALTIQAKDGQSSVVDRRIRLHRATRCGAIRGEFPAGARESSASPEALGAANNFRLKTP